MKNLTAEFPWPLTVHFWVYAANRSGSTMNSRLTRLCCLSDSCTSYLCEPMVQSAASSQQQTTACSVLAAQSMHVFTAHPAHQSSQQQDAQEVTSFPPAQTRPASIQLSASSTFCLLCSHSQVICLSACRQLSFTTDVRYRKSAGKWHRKKCQKIKEEKCPKLQRMYKAKFKFCRVLYSTA